MYVSYFLSLFDCGTNENDCDNQKNFNKLSDYDKIMLNSYLSIGGKRDISIIDDSAPVFYSQNGLVPSLTCFYDHNGNFISMNIGAFVRSSNSSEERFIPKSASLFDNLDGYIANSVSVEMLNGWEISCLRALMNLKKIIHIELMMKCVIIQVIVTI